MRNAFAAEVTALTAADERVVLLSGDIGNRLFDRFKEQHPERFLNCGVAEANMMSVAAGLALSGLRPVTYTITPFTTTRCLEQIRVDVGYHHAPVTIVGVGGGLSYASLGATHHSCEDIAFLRAIPGMTVLCPGDAMEVRWALRAALDQDGPVYIRLGKKGEPVIHEAVPSISIGEALPVRAGDDTCLVVTGNLLPTALEAADHLAREGVAAAVVSFPTVKPLDTAFLADAFERYPVVATIEEHSVIGGLGGSVAEWLADRASARARLCRIGTPDEFLHLAGEQEFAREHWGLSPEHIAERVLHALPRSAVVAGG